MKLSLVIPTRNLNDPKLKDLLVNIDRQNFEKKEIEVLLVTEGTSESAKAIGIRMAKGTVIGFLSSDNGLIDRDFLSEHYRNAAFHGAAYPIRYAHFRYDDLLNRYFALMGGNDPLAYYMGKNDRLSYLRRGRFNMSGSIGDNGYFIRKDLIEKTDLDNYYHVDNALEANALTVATPFTIWHRTGGNIFSFFKKRYQYGLEHAFNSNRRWHLVDFSKPKDVVRFLWFIFASLTVVEPLFLSLRGYLKVRDVAWFLHPIVSILTVFTYGCLVISLGIRRCLQSLSAPWTAQRA